MRLKIRTYVLFSFGLMLLLVFAVAGVAIDRTVQVGKLAGDLNGRVVSKTRIAGDIVELSRQLRFVDAFLSRSTDMRQDELARRMIEERRDAIDSRVATYQQLVDSDLERSLLLNFHRSRSAYLALQQSLLSSPVGERIEKFAANEEALTWAFQQFSRQATGLARLAEMEARAARQQATDIVRTAQATILIASALACATGVLIVALLNFGLFGPLAQITQALLSLAKGRLDVSFFPRHRGGEIDDMARALDVFRASAIALAGAHDELKAAHLHADALARHDALTGLPNRRMLTTTITEAIARGQRTGLRCGVLVLDLDRFKPINDIYGHATGDKVLVQVAERLQAALRLNETAARLGGDEFAVVLEFEAGSDAPARLAKRIAADITAPLEIEGRFVSIGASIGVSVWPEDGSDAETLLHAADLAMFRAKHDADGTVRFFKPEMDVELRARADLESRIRRAVPRGDIRPHYQPLVNIKHDAIIGFEVLARWHDADLVRPPAEFIQIAESLGLMPELTYSLLRQACRDARHWPGDLTLAVNITPAQISDRGFPGALFKLLAEENFPPERLEVEITENALMGNIASARAVISDLRQHGVKMSLDDFGTGYSSLHHLRELRFDKIKIDRSFVQSMRADSESSKIVETVLSLGRSLGVYTIAEGIEDADHLAMLLGKGCELGQGYHIGRPMQAAAVERLLLTHGSAPSERAA